VQVRVATLADAEAIRQIYNHAVVTSTVTFDLVPRTRLEQEDWLQARSGAHVVLVAVEDAERRNGDRETGGGDGEAGPRTVVGFASLSPYRDRPAYSTSVEDSVYVREDRQGLGIGRLLLSSLVDTATQHGFHAMVARIVGGHDASIGLHRSVGFELVGVEREIGRKFGRWLDVVLMQRLLGVDEPTAAEGPDVG
jgi:phosphinothricin acetyltransferase